MDHQLTDTLLGSGAIGLYQLFANQLINEHGLFTQACREKQKGDGSSPSHLGVRGIFKTFSTVDSRLDFRALSDRMMHLISFTALSISSLKTI
jgi:hypothetical protein